jgi:hypothetical protein
MLADFDESAAHVAAIVTDAGLGSMAGAVYKATSAPVVLIVPTAEFPLAMPLTVQFTVVSGCPVLVTVATTWTIPAGETVAMAGGLVDTVTPVIADCEVVIVELLEELLPPHPPKNMR